MQTLYRPAFWLLFALALLHSSRTTFADDLQSFSKTYCIQCHGENDPKGERRLDQVSLTVEHADRLIDLRDILDQLILGEMPPKDAKQPTADQRSAIIEQLTKSIESAQVAEDKNAQTVLRRLNRREYLNTIRDLFDFDMAMFDPTSKFPRDQAVEHMDNVGDALVTSGFLLQQYLEAPMQLSRKLFEQANFLPRKVGPSKVVLSNNRKSTKRKLSLSIIAICVCTNARTRNKPKVPSDR